MTKAKKPSAEDIELFRRSVGPVRRISSDRIGPVRRPPPPRPRPGGEAEGAGLPDTFSDAYDPGSVSAEETLFFARPGLQQRQLQRFRRGQLSCFAELDLHGMTAAIARRELMAFIEHCRERRIRCARIIHGKGYGSGGAAPVLKNRLNSWLRQHHDVLAFSSAQARHGGSGALY
ncbi:MAG TPA: Smr/MutS family protein, partial [Gammaproteobacteria bacterium]|nr:Smr/MutS family protein [Gammaproteobacteria bacterium]